MFISKKDVKKPDNLPIKIGPSYINYSMSVRNQGLILDNTLGMDGQVVSVYKSRYDQIRHIVLVRKFPNGERCNI